MNQYKTIYNSAVITVWASSSIEATYKIRRKYGFIPHDISEVKRRVKNSRLHQKECLKNLMNYYSEE